MTEGRSEQLARVAEIHDDWVVDHLEEASFDPRSHPDSDDYNVWHVDVDADAEAQATFMRRVAETSHDEEVRE